MNRRRILPLNFPAPVEVCSVSLALFAVQFADLAAPARLVRSLARGLIFLKSPGVDFDTLYLIDCEEAEVVRIS